MLVHQGVEDKVVPADEAERIVAGLRGEPRPARLPAFEGEDHGFRKPENIIRSFGAELTFYAQVFGFEPADDMPPLEIVRG